MNFREYLSEAIIKDVDEKDMDKGKTYTLRQIKNTELDKVVDQLNAFKTTNKDGEEIIRYSMKNSPTVFNRKDADKMFDKRIQAVDKFQEVK